MSFSKPGLIVFVIIFGGAGAYLLLTSRAAGGSANLFIAPPATAGLGTNGSDTDAANCVRFSSPVSAPPSGVGFGCATFQKAYTLAQPGDTVYLNWNGAWVLASQQKIGTSGNKTGVSGACQYPSDTTACINFTPALGLSPSLTSGVQSVAGLAICADYVEVSNFTFNQHTYTDSFGDTVTSATWGVGAGDNSCQPSGAPPHDIFIKNVISNGQIGVVGGANHVYVLGGAWQNMRNLIPELGGSALVNGVTTPEVNHNTFDGVTVTNLYGDDSGHHHMVCSAVYGGADYLTFKNMHYEGCATGPTPPYAVLRFSGIANGEGQDHITVEGSYFDDANGVQDEIVFNCNSQNCFQTNNIVRFNTLVGAGFWGQNDCPLKGGPPCGPNSGNKFYGNLMLSGSCQDDTASWLESYNVDAGGQGSCSGDGTSRYNTAISLISAGSPNYNGHLANCTQTAADFISTSSISSYPATDAAGISRPQGSKLDAGAYEDCPAGGGVCPSGDVNGDCHVTVTDLSIMLSNWGTTNVSCDLNSNGTVDIFDLSILLSHYGQ